MENVQVIEEVNCMRLYLIYMNERDSPGRFVKKNSENGHDLYPKSCVLDHISSGLRKKISNLEIKRNLKKK